MDFEEITLCEIAEIEDYAQLPFSDIGEEKIGVIKLRIALAWVMKRRVDPTFTIKQAEALTPNELGALFEGDGEQVKK